MITAEQARSLMEDGLSYIERKTIYELNTIESLINVKIASKEYLLVYTVYRNTLSNVDFVSLLRQIKQRLLDRGFKVLRIHSTDCSYFIFRISWDKEEEEE